MEDPEPEKIWLLVTSSLGVVAVLAVATIASLKIWYKAVTGICTSERRLEGCTALVTGANTGIGLETAKDFARRGARVLLACRNPQRGQRTLEMVRAVATPGASVELVSLDLASLTSVRACARSVLETEPRLDVLVNNAAAWGLGSARSDDGLHLGFQVNHLGPFLFTTLLVDLLKKSAPSRIIFVSSVMHHYVNPLKAEVLDFDTASRLSNYQVYNTSKLLNILVANELSRRLVNSGVTVNSVHPGLVYTEIHRHYPPLVGFLYGIIMKTIYKNAEEGAQTTIYAAVSEDVEGVTGRYFVDCQEAPMSRQACHEGLARDVWMKSEQLVSVGEEERIAF